MLWSKLKTILSNQGGNEKEDTDSLMSKYPNVNEEYKQTFRTNSYLEIFEQVRHHVRTDEEHPAAAASSSPQSENSHLFEHLLEPHQKTLTRSNFHRFLANYFEITLEASRVCESLLTDTHTIRRNHRGIKRVIKLIDRSDRKGDEFHDDLYESLASFASRRNPLSAMSSEKFEELHEIHVFLLHDLVSKCRRISRRKKTVRMMKRVVSVLGCSALAIAVVILAMHCVVGLVAAPGLVAWAASKAKEKCSESWLDGAAGKLDVAARGVYIMINDFATMGRAVRRLSDELERRRCLAAACVRKGKAEMVRKVVGEFQVHEGWFLEQLDDLEKQIYLCFLDINRSRRLIGREMFES